MYAFRQRPLSWLFWIATACISLALPSEKNENPAIIAMLFGQSFVLGGWVVIGHAHRLLRGGVFVAGVMAIALLGATKFSEPPHYPFSRAWSDGVGGVAILAGGAAVMTFIWRALLRLLPHRKPESASTRWQFPVAELFGWTIVVAVASAVMRTATFLSVGGNVEQHLAMLIFSLVAALLMALFLDEYNRTGPLSWLLAAAAVAAIFTVLPMFLRVIDREISIVVAGAYVYVGLWIMVCRFDRRIAEPRSVVPQLPVEE